MAGKGAIENKKKSNGGNLGFEEKLWQAADKMRVTFFSHIHLPLGHAKLKKQLNY